ncbi:hypothetical protein QBC34DRAFT_490796 [Podospora aff. communis PSN243]|uniref:Uncharacterized protein n=1 Tax=Podospora aff. communis PSN243 TaxID=3040156 RepID=A0AAV9H414_9PEZI|nr:hypothetical protein QBC34DRAFT_490796 [Podospora aff. communis PSN243]
MAALTIPSRTLHRDTMATNASEPAEQENKEKDPNRHSRTRTHTTRRGSSSSGPPTGTQGLVIPTTANNEAENARPKPARGSIGRYSMLSLSGILRDRENTNLSRPAPPAIRASSGLGIFLPRKFSSVESVESSESSEPGTKPPRSYRIKTFSFEDAHSIVSPSGSPEPELVVLLNKGELELLGSEEGAQVRTASSSYPSEAGGARSPDLSASPPMSFGRRILSSLEAYGFSNPHLASLGGSDASVDGAGVGEEKREADGEEKDTKADEIASGAVCEAEGSIEPDVLVIPDAAGHVVEATVIEEDENMDVASEGTLRRHPPKNDDDDIMVDDYYDEDNDRLSTKCLPRVSSNLDRVRLSADNGSILMRAGNYGSKPSFPRSAVSVLRRRFSHMNLKERPVKVKKWFVRQFRASRKGPRVIVKKVRERRARRKMGGGNASGNTGGKRKGATQAKLKRKSAGSMRILRPTSLLTMFSVSNAAPNKQGS